MNSYLFVMSMVCFMCTMVVLIESETLVVEFSIREPIQTVPFLAPQPLANPGSLITEEFL
ncbi:hypothetical protein [Cytobacillus sp. IB215316]|uniref:hypothetical protein n=1 Tax=Cytobacillus sp. IB215316 TaxID=3097354 RepID=UPI002A171D15|nr:hypothetical protein [Cytobacillus sp. IB215316]MDX8363228.1 hypothetical protein [Cytobacillus sp. IB215316]